MMPGAAPRACLVWTIGEHGGSVVKRQEWVVGVGIYILGFNHLDHEVLALSQHDWAIKNQHKQINWYCNSQRNKRTFISVNKNSQVP